MKKVRFAYVTKQGSVVNVACSKWFYVDSVRLTTLAVFHNGSNQL